MGQLASKTLRVMACHETQDAHCVGWLHHQLGEGNNIPLRLSMRQYDNAKDIHHPDREGGVPMKEDIL